MVRNPGHQLLEFIVAPTDPWDGRLMWLEARGYDHALDVATGMDPVRRDGLFHHEERAALRVQRIGSDRGRGGITLRRRKLK